MKLYVTNVSAAYVVTVTDETTGYVAGDVFPGSFGHVEVGSPYTITVRTRALLTVAEETGQTTEVGWLASDDTGGELQARGVPYTGVPDTVDVPGLGTVTLPDWAISPEMAVFFFGFATAAGIRLVRSALRWFKRADGIGDYDHGN
ncbi:MAG: hypothetical protein JNG83_02885 [Opitutaceae bacterium]|nr:hypothetical protein [Opitutaceae bacterium]